MGIKIDKGFTIIEIMLFLAVTGLLAVGILAGSGIAIGQQRYRDSVNSLKSFIQQQYSETTNVVNSRNAEWTCNAAGTVNEAPAGEARGTSDCVMLGRFVTINELGTAMAASNVAGYPIAGVPPAANDIDELVTSYRLGVSPIDQDEVEVSWGAQVVKPKTTNAMPLSLLIIRSPLSGTVLTFTVDGVKSNLKELIKIENMNKTQNLCVNADAGTFVGQRLAVQVAAYASNQGAIQIPAESANICD